MNICSNCFYNKTYGKKYLSEFTFCFVKKRSLLLVCNGSEVFCSLMYNFEKKLADMNLHFYLYVHLKQSWCSNFITTYLMSHSINKYNFLKKAKCFYFFKFFPFLHYLEFIYSKNYVNLTKIFVLRLFKMAANQTVCFRLKQKSVIKSLMVEKYKPCELYRRMCDVYRKACF